MKPRYIRVHNCETVELDGEWIVLHTDNYTVTKLNEVGGFCWSLLNEGQSIKSMIEAIYESYEWAGDTAEEDVESFLADMIKCGLVHDVI